MKASKWTLIILAAVCLGPVAAVAAPRLAERHPELTDGILSQARLDALPEGDLLRADDLVVTAAMLDEQVSELPEAMREEAQSYQFYLLERMAMERILMREILGETDVEPDEEALQAKIRAYMLDAVGDVVVSDAEAAAFYEENRDMLPDLTLEQVGAEIKEYLKQQKQEEAWHEHVRDMGKRVSIVLNDTWIDAQIKRMQDNPVDNARAGDKPVLANFSAAWCAPCRMLKPIIQSVKEKYGDQVAILQLDTEEHQFLSSRFKVSSIPLLIFYDKDGNEVLRHTGVMEEEELVAQLKKLGVS